MLYGYARVRTDDQSLAAQLHELEAAGAAHIFQETASGTRSDHTQLRRALSALAAGDTLIVTRLDRLARSTRDLLSVMAEITAKGASFRSLREAWADTSTPQGRLMLTVLGGLDEFERELLRQRTGEGRAQAKARGVHLGRPPRLTRYQRDLALKALDEGASQPDIARRFSVSQSTISRLAARRAVEQPAPSVKPVLDRETAHVAQLFMEKVRDKYPQAEGIIFGSRARQTHNPDSDADIAVVLKGRPTRQRFALVQDMSGLAFDVMQETGVVVQPLPVWEEELQRPEAATNPALIETIRREGLRL